jgi:four helix bundle protein
MAIRHGDHRDLVVWQKAMRLAIAVQEATTTFPRDEVYGLTSQIRRSATSIPTNIAEGAARRTSAEFAHFLGVARGSQAELDTQLILANAFGYLSEATLPHLNAQSEEVGRMLTALLHTIHRRQTR